MRLIKSLSIKKIAGFTQKLWSKGAFDILFGNFFTKFLVFFGTIFLVRVLTKQSYGVLGYIENIYSYVYIFAGMGLNNAVLRFILLSKNNTEEFGHYRYAIKKGSAFNLIIITLFCVVGYFYPYPPEFESAKILLPAIAIALPFQYLVDLNLYTYRSKIANRYFAVATFLFSGILIAAKYFSAVQWDLSGVIFAKIFVSAIFGILLSIVTYRKYFKDCKPYTLSGFEKKAVDRYSIQYMITNGVWAIFMLNDILLLGLLGSDASVIADYKVAYFLPGNLSILSGAIGMFVAPYFVKNENDNSWVRKNYFKTLLMTCLLIGFSIIILFVFSKQLIVLLFGSEYSNINNVMRLLLIASFANSGVRVSTANILASMGQIKYNMIISFSGIALQIVMNLLMIPRFGSVGVAITSITVYTLMAFALLIIFINKYRNDKMPAINEQIDQ